MNLLSACVLSTRDLVDRCQGFGVICCYHLQDTMECNDATVLQRCTSPCVTLLL